MQDARSKRQKEKKKKKKLKIAAQASGKLVRRESSLVVVGGRLGVVEWCKSQKKQQKTVTALHTTHSSFRTLANFFSSYEKLMLSHYYYNYS